MKGAYFADFCHKVCSKIVSWSPYTYSLSDRVSQVCQLSNQQVPFNKTLTILGWGMAGTEEGVPSQVLREENTTRKDVDHGRDGEFIVESNIKVSFCYVSRSFIVA